MFKYLIFFCLDVGVYIVGSSSNGFGTNKSDVDMCLMVSHEEVILFKMFTGYEEIYF
jgi:predicted nucleotidyltransferase